MQTATLPPSKKATTQTPRLDASTSKQSKEVASPVSLRLTHIGVGFPGSPGRSNLTFPEVVALRDNLLPRGYRDPTECEAGEIFLHKQLLPIELADMGPHGKPATWQLRQLDDSQEMHLPVKNPEAVHKFFELFGIGLVHRGFNLRFVNGDETDYHIGFHVASSKDLTKMKLSLAASDNPALQQLASDLGKNRHGSESGKAFVNLAGCGIEITFGPHGLRGHNIVQQTISRKESHFDGPYVGMFDRHNRR